MNKKAIAAFLMLFVGIGTAQDYKFRKVSLDEVQETVYDKDSTANAVFLYKNRKSYYRIVSGVGINLITDVHERVKIYNKSGMEYATKEFSLYKDGGKRESLTGLKAYTYNEENGKLAETKLGKDGIFKSEYSENFNEFKFTMPQAKKGSVLEYKYTITSPYYQYIDEFVFQEDIPTKRVDASMSIYGIFGFGQIQKGFLPINPRTETLNDAASGFKVVKNHYTMTDVPALKKENYVSNIDNFRSAVKFELKSVSPPNGDTENFATTWENVSKSIYKSKSFKIQMEQEGYYKDDLEVILAEAPSEMDKMNAIFAFVKSKVKWNDKRGVYAKNLRKAYKDGVGNVADINLMLISMLRYAKIDASPVLVSTRQNGIPLFPTLQGFNYVVAAAKINNNRYLLDATSPYTTPGILPVRALNWQGRLIENEEVSNFLPLVPKKQALENITMNVTLSDDGTIEGKCREVYTNHNAMIVRSNYNSTNEEEYIEKLTERRDDLEISNFNISNNKELGKSLMETYEFYKEDVAETINDKLYFSPLFHMAVDENPFKSEKREYPIEFGYPWKDKFLVNVVIPDGYEIESIPEPVSVSLPQDIGKFRYNISNTGGMLRISAETSMNYPIIPAQFYPALKQFYKNLVEKHTERVVLKKI
ncbi:DUF3857 domain-containing protein [Spongiivirga citrea]|uniref:DUF3857 domain-containing protein n=1 Tax=Spongiivirga citrea TaxID=1481457 RepID=A0A6M0CTF9_9FLAO|nr:DUF3857 domain-containing protein [Spongiivirga citrea]NER18807.1 DUF3857 domain-containing protein [Spongiivirga citrea]